MLFSPHIGDMMLPSGGVLEKARKARDPRFDGRFFIGVRTTGIYCRPVCPVRMPRAENVLFFHSAAAASEAGFRPCLRCRPESSPGTPAWRGSSTTVTRALRLINEGALDDASVGVLSDRLGVTSRHLSRLFATHLGASPKTVAQTRRLHFAKKLIDESSLSMTEVAMASGYGSVRRFNDHIANVYGLSPSQLRKRPVPTPEEGVTLRLSYRPPFEGRALLSFFNLRATPGVERVDDAVLTRTFQHENSAGQIRVEVMDDHLACSVRCDTARVLMSLIQRVRRMFDLDAVPQDINQAFVEDPVMQRLAVQNPGQRLPGAFDPFETSVRAIVGQQVSVKGATTVMGRIAAQYGHDSRYGLHFPTPGELAELDPSGLSMPAARARAIREFARQVELGELRFDMDLEAFTARVLSIKGIGPWTADYMAMRVLGDPDAFLAGDLVIRKVMQRLYGADNEKAVIQAAERWRPWRAYAGMHLWRNA